MTRTLMIAGVSSAVGKTSLTLGLLEALRQRGLTVQAFKVGPDFIDPQLHAFGDRATVLRPGRIHVRRGRRASGGGARDGGRRRRDRGRHDGVLRRRRRDEGRGIAGVIANRVGGSTHARWVADAIRAVCDAPPLGAVSHDAALTLPERHLGLLTAAEGVLTTAQRERLRHAVERAVALLSYAHLHFASNPRLAPTFADACAESRR